MSNKRIRNKLRGKEQGQKTINIIPQSQKEFLWHLLQGLKKSHKLLKEQFEKDEDLKGGEK